MEVSCKSIQVTVGVFSLRGGSCTDSAGKSYLDVGAGLGPGAGVYYFDSNETRSTGITPEARADIGLVKAGQASTLSGKSGGWGVGVSGQLGLRALIPTGSSGVSTRSSR
jgi:hypothetical protein